MVKKIVLGLLTVFLISSEAMAQAAALNKAKYITTLSVVAKYKLNDSEIAEDVDKLRDIERFKKDLTKMVNKISNDKPNNAKNQKILRILERAGREIYNELK